MSKIRGSLNADLMSGVHAFQLAEHESQQVRTAALDALDRAICGTLASPQFQETVVRLGAGKDSTDEGDSGSPHVEVSDTKVNGNGASASASKQENIPIECTLLQPLSTLYNLGRITDVRAGALRILLHVLEVSPTGRCTGKFKLKVVVMTVLCQISPSVMAVLSAWLWDSKCASAIVTTRS